MGIIQETNNLASCDHVNVSAFCRRRLPVVLVKLKMSENLQEAITLIEGGHIRVGIILHEQNAQIGPETITDPAFLVTRTMEDYITWVDNSKIRRHIMKYQDQVDDYDLMQS